MKRGGIALFQAAIRLFSAFFAQKELELIFNKFIIM
jgi:hypothetical protein